MFFKDKKTRYLWQTRIALALILVAFTGSSCAQHQQQDRSARVIIKFADAEQEPPRQLSVAMPDGENVTAVLNQMLAGGFYRYELPSLTDEQLRSVVQTLNARADIEVAELDRVRRID